MLLETIDRTISGRGIIKIPESYQEARDVFLYVTLLRPNVSEYLNVQWNPPKKFLANVTFCLGDYVLSEHSVNYDKQVFQIYDGQSAQNLLSLICANDNILDSFVNFAQSLGLLYFKNNSITKHGYNTFVPDTIRFDCYGGTALQLSLRGNKLDKCKPDDGTPQPPPPPPVPFPPLPPDSPVEVSPPYDPNTGDDGDTEPFPIDNPETDVPPTTACIRYAVGYRLTSPSYPNPVEAKEFVFGVLKGYTQQVNADGGVEIAIIAGNVIAGECVQDQVFSVFSNVSQPAVFEIISVEEI